MADARANRQPLLTP